MIQIVTNFLVFFFFFHEIRSEIVKQDEIFHLVMLISLSLLVLLRFFHKGTAKF